MEAVSRRYDRQLRVWGTTGQSLLETSKVCLLNCGPTGSEALKNLVLGGIASFTVVDASPVTSADLGNNFLVNPEGLGSPRAAVVADLLRELNPTVSGSFLEEAPEALVDKNPGFFNQFTLVIATQVRHLIHIPLSSSSAIRLACECPHRV